MKTLKVKLNPDSPTPITSLLATGASGDWVLGKENVDEISTIEMYDSLHDQVYSSPVIDIVEVPTDHHRPRYRVVFDKNDVTIRSENYDEKGFKFTGHGVAYS